MRVLTVFLLRQPLQVVCGVVGRFTVAVVDDGFSFGALAESPSYQGVDADRPMVQITVPVSPDRDLSGWVAEPAKV